MAITIFLLEGIPQLLILALSMIHWHGPFETVVIDLFCTTVNVPLSVWYLSFYCNPRIQLAVVSKILMEARIVKDHKTTNLDLKRSAVVVWGS